MHVDDLIIYAVINNDKNDKIKFRNELDEIINWVINGN